MVPMIWVPHRCNGSACGKSAARGAPETHSTSLRGAACSGSALSSTFLIASQGTESSGQTTSWPCQPHLHLSCGVPAFHLPSWQAWATPPYTCLRLSDPRLLCPPTAPPATGRCSGQRRRGLAWPGDLEGPTPSAFPGLLQQSALPPLLLASVHRSPFPGSGSPTGRSQAAPSYTRPTPRRRFPHPGPAAPREATAPA